MGSCGLGVPPVSSFPSLVSTWRVRGAIFVSLVPTDQLGSTCEVLNIPRSRWPDPGAPGSPGCDGLQLVHRGLGAREQLGHLWPCLGPGSRRLLDPAWKTACDPQEMGRGPQSSPHSSQPSLPPVFPWCSLGRAEFYFGGLSAGLISPPSRRQNSSRKAGQALGVLAQAWGLATYSFSPQTPRPASFSCYHACLSPLLPCLEPAIPELGLQAQVGLWRQNPESPPEPCFSLLGGGASHLRSS